MENKKKHVFFLLICLVGTYFVCLFGLAPIPVAAQNTAAPINVSQSFGLNNDFDVGVGQKTDLKDTVAKVINVVLGFLGIAAVVLIAVGGLMWMSAAGNEDKIAVARRLIINACIGLVIIFSSWVIASFVINQLGSASGVESAGGSGTPPPPGLSPNPEPPGGSSPVPGQPPTLPPDVPDLPHNDPPAISSDTDNDGLDNDQETAIYCTDPNAPDSDGDTFLDGAEVTAGYTPLSNKCERLTACLAGSLQANNQEKETMVRNNITLCCAESSGLEICKGL